MSKLNKLIEDLCPNGVEYKTVGEMCEVITGGEAPVESIKSKIPCKDYIYPIYSNGIGENSIWGYSKKYRIDKKAVTFSSIGTIGYPTIRNQYFTPIIRLKIIYPKNEQELNLSFLKYSLEIVKFEKQKSSVPNINSSMIKNIVIPVPPMKVQQEIVQILDKFSKIEAELEAELEARKKQYEYYKDILLKNYSSNGNIMLKEIAEYSKDKINAEELNEDNYVGVDNLLPNKQGKKKSNHIPQVGNLTKYHINDILIGNIRPYLKKIWYANNKGGTNGDVLVIHITNERVNPQYLYYILSSDKFFNYDTSNSKGAKMPRGNKDAVMKYKFFLPTMEEQNKIVNILDKFEKLCNDISEGLPAEIEARQKQYEYYRDKLLTFKELKVNE